MLALGLALAQPSGAQQPPGADLRARMLWNLGYELHMQGRFPQAIEKFRQSIALHPTAEAHTYLGWSLAHLGRLTEAIAECKTAIRLDPEFGNPYNDIGVYLLEQGRKAEAIPWFRKAIKAKRYCCYQFAHFNLGRVLLEEGKIAQAKRSFERALQHDPGYEPAREGLELIRRSGLREL
jgi:tetratricopeptide (TPR) repeat protein